MTTVNTTYRVVGRPTEFYSKASIAFLLHPYARLEVKQGKSWHELTDKENQLLRDGYDIDDLGTGGKEDTRLEETAVNQAMLDFEAMVNQSLEEN